MTRESVLFPKLNKYVEQLKTDLQMSDQELANHLKISLKDLECSKEISTRINPNSPKKEEELSHLIMTYAMTVSDFKKHQMTLDDILITLNHVFDMTDGSKTTILELAKTPFVEGWGTLQGIREAVCEKYFNLYEIGDRMSPLKKLNKEIAEKLFGNKVEVKKVWVYSEGGDYEILKTQERTSAVEVNNDVWLLSENENSQVLQDSPEKFIDEVWENLRNFSGDMREAWKLVEMLAEKKIQIRLSNKAMGNDYWWCYLSSDVDSPASRPDSTAQAGTAPEAICIAILQYLENKKVN